MENNNSNDKDNWSNRNWQDARSFSNMWQSNQDNQKSESMFDSIFRSNRGWNNTNNNQNQGGFLTQPGNNSKIGGNWMRGRNSLSVIVIVLVVIIIYTFYSQFAMNEGITKSTIQRTKIESTFDYEKDECYRDLGTTVEDESPLRNSFKTFHNKTGVIPYVYILPIGDETENLESLAAEQYEKLISDENHFFVVLQPNGDTACNFTYVLGENAKKVMDDEAIQIFTDYLKKFYESRQTDNQTYLVNAYGYTADRIMSTANFSVKSVIFGIIVIILLICVIVYWVKKKKKQEAENSDPNAQRIERDMNRRW